MMRKTLIAALAFAGIAAAGTMTSATPAAAGYACGPWNGWCSYYARPYYGWGWYGGGYNRPYYGNRYGNRHYGHNNWRGGKNYHKGGDRKHAYKKSGKRDWR